jgi:hypothetical protein
MYDKKCGIINEEKCSICYTNNTKLTRFIGKDFCSVCLKAKNKEIAARDTEYREKLFQTINR